VGEEIGLKTSTAFVPPELAAILFRPTETLDDLVAEVTQLEEEQAIRKEQTPKDRAPEDWAKLKEISCKLQILGDKIAILQDTDDGESKLRARTEFDVWGFGAVMYEMLCGR
jgi:hypothetical protein